MIKFALISLLTLLVSCSTPVVEDRPSPETAKFLTAWAESHEELEPAFLPTYEKYLHSVEAIFKKLGHESEYHNYLSSNSNNAQILSHKENILPIVYRKQNHTVRRAMNFELYRTKELSQLRDKIYADREQRLTERLGVAFVDQLKANYTRFMTEEKAEKFAFPL
jgi:hypothetical protein